MPKTLKFAENLVPLVLSGQKTATWRLFDDKNLSVGDQLNLINKSTGQVFAHANIIHVSIKKFKDLQPSDYDGHEKYSSAQQMYTTYTKYYEQPVNEKTEVKIIHFTLI